MLLWTVKNRTGMSVACTGKYTQDEAEPFSQLKDDWKITKMWLNGIPLPFSHLSRPFSYNSVHWMAEIHPVTVVYRGWQGCTVGDRGLCGGMCTVANRGLQGVQGLTGGAQGMTGKTQRVTGKDKGIFIRTWVLKASNVNCLLFQVIYMKGCFVLWPLPLIKKKNMTPLPRTPFSKHLLSGWLSPPITQVICTLKWFLSLTTTSKVLRGKE